MNPFPTATKQRGGAPHRSLESLQKALGGEKNIPYSFVASLELINIKKNDSDTQYGNTLRYNFEISIQHCVHLSWAALDESALQSRLQAVPVMHQGLCPDLRERSFPQESPIGRNLHANFARNLRSKVSWVKYSMQKQDPCLFSRRLCSWRPLVLGAPPVVLSSACKWSTVCSSLHITCTKTPSKQTWIEHVSAEHHGVTVRTLLAINTRTFLRNRLWMKSASYVATWAIAGAAVLDVHRTTSA